MHFKGIVVFVEEDLSGHILEHIVEDAVNLQSLRLEYGRDAIPSMLPD
jgi:hypothetical protein